MSYLRWVPTAGLVAVAVLVGRFLIEPLPAVAQPAAGGEWTVEDCSACHEDVTASFELRPHGSTGDAAAACASCHGDPTAHLDSGGEGGVVSFAAGSPWFDRVGACLDCHGDSHPRFTASEHARAGMDCASCHTIHGPTGPGAAGRNLLPIASGWAADEIGGTSASCADCHDDVAHDFALNERHRLREGILSCSSCHDPHAPEPRMRLAAFKDESCSDCHADKTGPFVFEHGASRVEGCVACHTPHGSVNRHMLVTQNVGELCYTCHATVPQFHVGFAPVGPPRFGLDANCTNCHSSIHGSNFDPFFLK